MTTNFRKILTFTDACTLASELYGTMANSEGTPEECFLAGWENAADMIENGSLDGNDRMAVLTILFSEVNNMYPNILTGDLK